MSERFTGTGKFGRIADAFIADRDSNMLISIPGFKGLVQKNSPEGLAYQAALGLRNYGELDKKVAEVLGCKHPNYRRFSKSAKMYIQAADSISKALEDLGKKIDKL